MKWLLFVLLATAVLAEIQVPDNQYYNQDAAPLRFNFMVWNGTPIDNTTASCSYILSFNNGTIASQGLAQYSSTWYFEFTPEALTTYQYMLWCDAEVATGHFKTTPEGDDKEAGFIWLIVILPLIFSLILVIATNSLNEDHEILKVVAYFFTFISLWSSFYLSAIILTNYYGSGVLQASIGSITFYIGVTFFAIMSYFVIYSIYKMVRTAAQDKEERLRY